MKSPDCIFCKIVDGEIPSTKIYENDKVLAFKDLRPNASIHYLFIHKNHTKDINDMSSIDPDQLIDIFAGINEVTRKENLSEKGFRVVTNTGPNAGQTVFHTHFHVLAGEPLNGFGSR